MVKDNTNAWLIGLVALVFLGCIGLTAMQGLFDDLPGQLASGEVERQVGPQLTQTAAFRWDEQMAVENNSAAADSARANERAEVMQPWRVGAGITFYIGTMLILAVGSFGGAVWLGVFVWRKVEEARTLPLIRVIGDGLQIVYPALGQRGHPMLVDTVTGGSWPLYDALAVQNARVRYMERMGVVDRLTEGAEKIAKSTGNAKPGDWLHQIAEYSKVEVGQ